MALFLQYIVSMLEKWFKNQVFSTVCFTLILSACGGGSGEKTLESLSSSVSFEAQMKTSLSLSESVSNKTWGNIKETSRVKHTFCLKNKVTGDNFINESFEIENTFSSSKKILKSDPSGCLRWIEDYSFNFMNKEKYFKFNLKIKSLRSGEQVIIPMAINPWSDDVLDLRYSENIDSKRKLVKSHSLKLIDMERVLIKSISKKFTNDVTEISYTVAFKPYFQRQKYNNSMERVNLENISVGVSLSLYGRDFEGEAVFLGSSEENIYKQNSQSLISFKTNILLQTHSEKFYNSYFINIKVFPRGKGTEFFKPSIKRVEMKNIDDFKSLNPNVFSVEEMNKDIERKVEIKEKTRREFF